MKVKIREGRNTDSGRIRELLEKGGFPKVDIDWSDISLSWVVAVKNGKVVGAINVGFGRPIGRAELMCADKGLSDYEKMNVYNSLWEKAQMILRAGGSKMVMSLIADKNPKFQALVKKHHGKPIDAGKLFVYML